MVRQLRSASDGARSHVYTDIWKFSPSSFFPSPAALLRESPLSFPWCWPGLVLIRSLTLWLWLSVLALCRLLSGPVLPSGSTCLVLGPVSWLQYYPTRMFSELGLMPLLMAPMYCEWFSIVMKLSIWLYKLLTGS